MTSDDFRSSTPLRECLLALLQDATLQQALGIIKSKNELVVMPLGVDGLDHARALTERQTRALVVAELFEMTRPLPDAPAERPAEDLGTPHTIDDFDQQEPAK